MNDVYTFRFRIPHPPMCRECLVAANAEPQPEIDESTGILAAGEIHARVANGASSLCGRHQLDQAGGA